MQFFAFDGGPLVLPIWIFPASSSRVIAATSSFLPIRSVFPDAMAAISVGPNSGVLPGYSIAPLLDDLAKAVQENVVHRFTGQLVQVGHTTFGQEQVALIAQHDGFACRAILGFLERQFAHVTVRLFAFIRLCAFQILPEAERAVPCG